jgi:hypothetical protein
MKHFTILFFCLTAMCEARAENAAFRQMLAWPESVVGAYWKLLQNNGPAVNASDACAARFGRHCNAWYDGDPEFPFPGWLLALLPRAGGCTPANGTWRDLTGNGRHLAVTAGCANGKTGLLLAPRGGTAARASEGAFTVCASFRPTAGPLWSHAALKVSMCEPGLLCVASGPSLLTLSTGPASSSLAACVSRDAASGLVAAAVSGDGGGAARSASASFGPALTETEELVFGNSGTAWVQLSEAVLFEQALSGQAAERIVSSFWSQ